jgi:hypothetical protein
MGGGQHILCALHQVEWSYWLCNAKFCAPANPRDGNLHRESSVRGSSGVIGHGIMVGNIAC